MITLHYTDSDFSDQLAAFCRTATAPKHIADSVRDIISAISERGDAAIIEFLQKIDGVSLTPEELRVPAEQLKAAADALSDERRSAIEQAIESVRAFHSEGLPRSWQGSNPHGALVGEKFYPIERVGIYTPGGQVPLASTIVMTATPAKLAGVPSVAAFTPPGKNGVDPNLLATYYLCGVREVYRVGGPMAIAAAAYGTQSIPAVCKIFGPGNVYTNEAKRQVLGTVGIDILAGTSEVMIICDESANPDYVAADLLAQAEHDPRVKLYLTIPSEAFLQTVLEEIGRQKATLRLQQNIDGTLEDGFLAIVCDSLDQAIDAANRIAPEHLELHTEERTHMNLLEAIHTAGAIFMGHQTPTVLGDFAAGPNHTLPTGCTGRFYSGLQITDFMRRSSFVRYSRDNLIGATPIVRAFSAMEQLDAHGQSLEIRLRD
ncbi:MAG: histidinol dehydrogenase [Opitutales bacterium]|nr:histidinol dehydrogenase [Opitutales bacterium]